jgi:hypothetical protein
LFASVAKEAPKAASEKKLGLLWNAKVVSNILENTKVLPSSHMLYVATRRF